jgi:uncharacterized protein
MQVSLNQHVKVAEDGGLALNVLEGKVYPISKLHRDRIRLLRDSGPQEYESQDLELLESGVLRLAEHAAIEIATVRKEIQRYLDRSGALCVMPTEKCNFRCTYCYETFLKGRMSDSIIDGVIRFLSQQAPRFESYSLAWFGGEPLLQRDVILRIGAAYRELQQKNKFGGSIAITTNGSLLTEPTLRLLADIDVNLYHISVDGPRELHDSQRVTLGGHSTYHSIMDNIERALETTDCHILFRVNMDTTKPRSLLSISPWLVDEVVPRFARFGTRIKFLIVSIWDATTTSVEGICISEFQRFQYWFDTRCHLAAALGTNALLALSEETAGVGSLACYAGKPNHYVVGSDGQVYKCTVAFDLPANQVGYITPAGELVLDRAREAMWVSSNSLTDGTCGACAFHASCMGLACPLTRIQTGSQPCPTPKRFIGEILSSEESRRLRSSLTV